MEQFPDSIGLVGEKIEGYTLEKQLSSNKINEVFFAKKGKSERFQMSFII